LILIAEWKLYETACGGGVKTWPWRFWKHYYYSIDIQLDKEKEIYLMFLKLETDKNIVEVLRSSNFFDFVFKELNKESFKL